MYLLEGNWPELIKKGATRIPRANKSVRIVHGNITYISYVHGGLTVISYQYLKAIFWYFLFCFCSDFLSFWTGYQGDLSNNVYGFIFLTTCCIIVFSMLVRDACHLYGFIIMTSTYWPQNTACFITGHIVAIKAISESRRWRIDCVQLLDVYYWACIAYSYTLLNEK